MAYSYQPVRWQFEITSSNNVVGIEHGVTTGSDTINIGDYINQDDTTTSGSPFDFINAFEVALNGAIADAGGLGGITATVYMTSTGNVIILHDGTSPGDDFDIDWTVTNSVLASVLGYTGSSTTIRQFPTLSAFQAQNQWHPAIQNVYDSGEVARQIVTETRNLVGQPIRLVQSAAEWYERLIEWERIYSARIKDVRADDVDYASRADIATGEDNTWENLWRYLIGPYNSDGNNEVFVYPNNDPGGNPGRDGPYEVLLEQSKPDLMGVGLDTYRRPDSAEFFDVSLTLWKG